MKALKLLLIFIVLVGGIFMALNWETIFSGGEDDFPSQDLIDIDEKCDEIRNAWVAQSTWSPELYDIEREDIDQSKKMGMFSKDGYNTVNNCLRETVTNKVVMLYMNALKASTFVEKDLLAEYKGVEYVCSAEKLDENERIKNVKNIHKLYINVRNYVKSPHKINAEFDTSNLSWTSFNSLKSGIIKRAKDFLDNRLFKEIEHIPGFKDGLNLDTLENITERQREGYYLSLAQQIISHFETLEPTNENLEKLSSIYTSFVDEATDDGISRLAIAKVSFQDKVEQALKNESVIE